jgi:hypothetical protein
MKKTRLVDSNMLSLVKSHGDADCLFAAQPFFGADVITMRHSQAWFMLVLGALVCASLLGCQEAARSDAQATRPSPEESFKEIVRVVTNTLDTRSGGMPSGFVSTDEGGRSQFIVNNEVASEFIPPTADGEPFRGVITVTSRSYYSLLRSDGAVKDDKKSKRGKDEFSMVDDAEGDEFGSTNDGLVSEVPSADDAAQSKHGDVYRRPDEDVSQFDLVYENDRWVLKTEPDAKTELAVKKAFDYALGLQR